MKNDNEWFPTSKTPAAYKPITCLGADENEYVGLCFSTHRNAIIDPITNLDAEPLIGPIQGWRYDQD